MKIKLIQVLVLALSIPAGSLIQAQERAGDFALLDAEGYFHHMSWYDNHEALVFMVQANADAAVHSALPGFSELAARFEARNLEFFLLNPMGAHNRDAVHAEMQRLGI